MSKITNEILEQLCPCFNKQLLTLNFSNNRITNEGLSHLRKHYQIQLNLDSKLEQLNLKGNELNMLVEDDIKQLILSC